MIQVIKKQNIAIKKVKRRIQKAKRVHKYLKQQIKRIKKYIQSIKDELNPSLSSSKKIVADKKVTIISPKKHEIVEPNIDNNTRNSKPSQKTILPNEKMNISPKIIKTPIIIPREVINSSTSKPSIVKSYRLKPVKIHPKVVNIVPNKRTQPTPFTNKKKQLDPYASQKKDQHDPYASQNKDKPEPYQSDNKNSVVFNEKPKPYQNDNKKPIVFNEKPKPNQNDNKKSVVFNEKIKPYQNDNKKSVVFNEKIKPYQNDNKKTQLKPNLINDKPKKESIKFPTSIPLVSMAVPSNICKKSGRFKTNIYHILGKYDTSFHFNPNDNPEVNKFITIKDDFQLSYNLKNALLECKRYNILIYCSALNNSEIAQHLQNALTFCINNIPIIRFKNVSIIMLCSSKLMIGEILHTPMKNNTQIFRKVVNVVSADFNSKKSEFTYGNQLYVSKYHKTYSSSNKLNDQWWYKWQMGVPACASGRLVQVTGTCWFNSSLNMLLLSNISKKMLILKWNQLPQKEKDDVINFGGLDKCLLKSAPLKKMLFIVIYNILIMDEQSQSKQGNWIKELAGLTKSLILTKSESTYANLKVKHLKETYADGEFIDNSIRILFGVLGINFKSLVLNTIERSEEFRMLYQKNYEKKITIKEKAILAHYNTIVKNQNTVWQKLKNNLHPIFNLDELNSTCKFPEWKNDKIPLYIHIHPQTEEILNLPEIITVNNTRYIIESCGIRVADHAIAGLRCNDIFYVYDSNNYIIKTNWHKGDISHYREICSFNFDKYYFNSLVYVKEDIWLKSKN